MNPQSAKESPSVSGNVEGNPEPRYPGAIVITGTRKGLGKAMAEHYLAHGCYVVGCSRGATSIDHPHYRHFSIDVADETGVTKMLRTVARDHGIFALINNAGIAAMSHLLVASSGTARSVLNTNFIGPFIAIREAGKLMRKQRLGRIINFTTVAVPLNLEGEALYAASKAALESLTRTAARELAPFGITVNAIGPCPMDTDLTRAVPSAAMDRLVARQAVPRMATADDLLPVVDFFLSANTGMLTGQTLYLGGPYG